MARREAFGVGLVLVSALALTSGRGRAWAWGPNGHVIVARLAEAHLNAKAKGALKGLLGGRDLADISSWADDWRGPHPETAKWHFVDIPLEADDFQETRDCAARACVLDALADQLTTLASPQAPQADREKALRFVVHFVADLHQPLHAADHGDRGGNQVKARLLLPDPDFPYDSGPNSQLHGIWDGDLIESAHRDQAAYVAQLSKLPAPVKQMQDGTPTAWVLEAHAIARQIAYALLPPADTTGVRPLDAAYVAKARPAAELQLQRAGVRLARLLNETLGAAPKKK